MEADRRRVIEDHLDDDGVTRTVLGLPKDPSTPVDVLDDTGNLIEHLPRSPVDADVFGTHLEADGTWVGDEALFWISDPEWGAGLGPPDGDGSEVWALNPATHTWRPIPLGISRSMLTVGALLPAVPDSAEFGTTPTLLDRPPTASDGVAMVSRPVSGRTQIGSSLPAATHRNRWHAGITCLVVSHCFARFLEHVCAKCAR
jgi:hypothetical protein